MKKFIKENLKNAWFWFFAVIVIALLFIMPTMSRSAGNTGDEDSFQIPQGENVINYFKTNGQDTTCLNFKDNLQYYGSSFDVIAAFLAEKFHVEDINILRHSLNALLGWLAILAVGLIAYEVSGFRAACFAMLLLFLSPRFLGHSFNNPKDLPFAAGVIMSIYGMVLFFKQFPKVKWYTYVILVLSIAYAISIRIGGLILFGYFGLMGLIYLIREYRKGKSQKLDSKSVKKNAGRFSAGMVLRMLLMGLAICVVGYFAGLVLWPYALQAPIKNPMEAFKLMSSFDVSLRQLFEGTMQWSDYLPWYYTPKYILMTIPIAVIVGLVLFFIFCWRRKEDRFWAFFVFFTFSFPVFWIVYTHANVYGGWRHAMFSYPPMVVAAGWGFEGLVQWLEKRLQVSGSKFQDPGEGRQQDAAKNWKPVLLNVSSVALVLVLLIGPIKHIVANHPYEYVYFNELVGGTKNQLGQYELDYYYHSTREASEWVLANAERKPDGSKVKVATWHTASVQYFFRKDTADFQVGFVRWYEQEYSDWDYAIFTVTGIAPEYLRSKYFPPKNTVKTIEVDGVPIAVVLKREDRNAYYASQVSKDATKLDSAIMLYGRALSYDPNNLCALQGMGECYLRTARPDSALYYLDRYHAIDPEAEMSNYLRAYSYVYKNDAKSSLAILHQLEKQNPKYSAAYALSVQLYLQMKDYPSAKKEFDRAIENERMDDQMVRLWLQYNAAQNIDEQHAYISLYKKMAKSYEKKGKKKEAEQYRNLIGMK